MKPTEIYEVVYNAVIREADRAECRACEGHKTFAKAIPDPKGVSEEEAIILSAMVIFSPSNDWGLEGFFQTPVEGGEKLGEFVRNNLPNYRQYFDSKRMEALAKKFLTTGS